MKLVDAKCPSCGANIDVDADSKTTICNYCKSKIFIDDAITKLKIEITGDADVNNSLKLENYMKLGNRNYTNEEYNEALEYYLKVLELDADYCLAILRKGICQTMVAGFSKVELNHALNGIRNVYEVLEKNNQLNEINQYIIEVQQTFNMYFEFAFNYYNKHHTEVTFTSSKADEVSDITVFCIKAFEYLYSISDYKNTKKMLLTSLISSLDFILQIDDCIEYQVKREKYLCELDPEYAIKKEEENKKHEMELQKKEIRKRKKAEVISKLLPILLCILCFICFIMIIILIMMILSS